MEGGEAGQSQLLEPSGERHARPLLSAVGRRHAIFFHDGFAIHGTNDIARLSSPASHGCVRLHPANAATLFALAKGDGRRNTRIEISN
jgi:lipoprotein-anchoring transpeptidase ErfK/SrfK